MCVGWCESLRDASGGVQGAFEERYWDGLFWGNFHHLATNNKRVANYPKDFF